MMSRRLQAQQIEVGAGAIQVAGDSALLSLTKLALLCSQKCPGDVILKTYDFARMVRESGRAVVSGFHSAIEKDCLPILLRGHDPVIIVPAHRLSMTRLPQEWQKALDQGRLLLLSPFDDKHKRVTTELATERNRFVARIADEVLIPYAHPGGKTEALCRELLARNKRVYAFHSAANNHLIQMGAVAIEPDHFSKIECDVTSCCPV